MTRRNFRSVFSKLGLSKGEPRASREDRATTSVMRRVGRAIGLEAGGDRLGMLDALEHRTMLEGSFATAILVNLDTEGRGNSPGVINPAVPSTDDDYYQFVAPSNDFVRVLADTANEDPASVLNTRVRVFNSAQQLIAQGLTNGNLTSGLQRDGWSGFVAQSGQTYYVIVSSDYLGPKPNLTTGNTYTLEVAALSTDLDIDPDSGIGRDPNTPAPPPPAVWPVGGNIAQRQQDLVWKHTATVTSLVTLNAQFNDRNYQPPFLPGTIVPDRLDTRLEVYNSAGVLVASDSDAGRLNDAFTSFLATQGETYYIRLRSDEVRARVRPNDPAFDLSLATGDVWLLADTESQNIPLNQTNRRGSDRNALFGFDDPDPLGNLPTPGFHTALYDFTAAGDGLAFITVTPDGLFPVNDPAVRLFDASGNLLAYNDNFGGTVAQLQVRLVGGSKYYLVVDGFALNNQVQYAVFLEANHTENNTQQGVDDHVNTPAIPQNPTPAETEAIRRQFQLATGLTWGPLTPTFDANQNEIRDRGLTTTAVGSGRIYTVGDSDLFQFTPPTDMLIDYDGNNDDVGLSMFIGGSFEFGSNNTPWLTRSRDLTNWDANDYWYTGAQFFDAANDVTYGFNDNPDTPGTERAEIKALLDYDRGFGTVPQGMSRRWLIVGGDFDLIVPGPFGPVTFKNLVVWFQDTQTGEWGWGSLGDVDGPVNAITTYTPQETVPDTLDPSTELEVDRPEADGQAIPYLVIGGEFTDVDGVAAANIATWDGLNGWVQVGTGTDGPVHSFTVYDAADAGEERDAQPGPPPLTLVPDSRDIPLSLYIGGEFTTLNGQNVRNLGYWDGLFFSPLFGGPAGPFGNNFGPDGPVRALTTYVGWDPDGEGEFSIEAPEATLIVGGDFNNVRFGPTPNDTLAVNDVFAWGFLGGVRDPDLPNYAPRLTVEDLDGGITDPNANGDGPEVLALATWDPPDINNDEVQPILVIGGSFAASNGMENLTAFAVFDGVPLGYGWLNNSTGTNGTVRAISTSRGFLATGQSGVDEQEPGIPTDLNSGVPQEVLYVGGDFTEVINDPLAPPVAANHVAQFAAFHDPLSGQDFFQFTAMAGGVNNADPDVLPGPTVFALAAFDDGNPLEWDRHDRPATRVDISVSPADGSFINAFVRVYDSNFNLIYTNDTIAPPFPDPAGMIDPSLSPPPIVPQQIRGIKVWAGETYYLEVTDAANSSTGRYNLQVRVDAEPLDLNADGVLDDVNAQMVEEPNEGSFVQALGINLPLGTGDSNNFRAANTAPLKGNTQRVQAINPSTNNQFNTVGDIGLISTIDDTDLYTFRAQYTGFVEVRISTTLIGDSFGEYYNRNDDPRPDPDPNTSESRPVSSLFDGALRVFRNDFEQIGYNDDNPAVQGEFAEIPFGSLGFRRFYGRDARVVIPVVAGNVYYVQVESGQKYVDGSPVLVDDRVANVQREVDVRRATGAYELLINAMPALFNDIENGQVVVDDHIDLSQTGDGALATPIALGDRFLESQNGQVTFTGIINNTPLKPFDDDLFRFIVPGSGTLSMVATRGDGSSINLEAFLLSAATGDLVATAQPISNGGARFDLPVLKGEEYFLIIRGGGSSEGAYQVQLSGVPDIDDHADFAKLWQASDIQMRDFLGLGQASGSINFPGDTDVFRFSFETFWSSVTIDVTAQDVTLDPTVTVYEVSEDAAGNPTLLRVGFNDDASANSANSRVTVPITPDRGKFPDGGEPRLYPYYYVVVQGFNPFADEGDYTVSVAFPATDDHPDAPVDDAEAPTVVDTSEFSFATRVVVDTGTGLGNSVGTIERVGDTDLFQFTSPASGPAEIVISRPTGSLLRSRVFILDAAGTILATGTGQDSITFDTSSAGIPVNRNGVYYIMVEGFEETGTPNTETEVTGEYTVSVTAPPIDDHPNESEFDLATSMAFNTLTGVARIGGTAPNDAANARLNPANDTDLFTFAVFLTGNQVITVSPFNANGTFAPRLTIFNANFQQIAQVSATSPLQEISTTISGTQGQRYYILVSAVDGVTGATLTGEYAVQVAGPVPDGGGGGGEDPGEIDFNAPTVINLNARTGDGSLFDQISPAGDRDLFTFTTMAAGKVFIQVIAPDGSLLDASVQVLNSPNELPGSQVAFDSDGTPGSTANLAFDSAAGVQYWVIVDGQGQSVGSYEIRVNTQPVANRLFFPEGFAATNISEFLSIINPNSVDVNYTVFFRYEWGSATTAPVTGRVRANSRDGLTIINREFSQLPGIVLNVPYAIEIVSDQPLGATLAHYDFGSSVGDSFTETVAPSWSFPRVERNPGEASDFIVFYNPNAFAVDVTLTAYQNGQEFSVTRRVNANRRGGFDINGLSELPIGISGVVITSKAADAANQNSFIGVVASISHYSITGDAAFATLGSPVTAESPLGGSTRGVMMPVAQGDKVASDLVFFNPGSTTATVTLTGSYIGQNLPPIVRNFDIPARSVIRLTGESLGLINSQSVGFSWASNNAITAISGQTQNGDGDATQAAIRTANQFYFGDAFIDVAEAGQQYFETVFLHNPTNQAANVTVRLVFFDRTVSTFTVNVAARSYGEIRLHERPEIVQQRTGQQWFAVDLASSTPFMASMVHYDLFFGGGWNTSGVPFGLTNALPTIS